MIRRAEITDEAIKIIARGEIVDAKTIAALYRAREFVVTERAAARG
jgi:hypothetical protein